MHFAQPFLVAFWLCALALAAPTVKMSSDCAGETTDGPVCEEQTLFEYMATVL